MHLFNVIDVTKVSLLSLQFCNFLLTACNFLKFQILTQEQLLKFCCYNKRQNFCILLHIIYRVPLKQIEWDPLWLTNSVSTLLEASIDNCHVKLLVH